MKTARRALAAGLVAAAILLALMVQDGTALPSFRPLGSAPSGIDPKTPADPSHAPTALPAEAPTEPTPRHDTGAGSAEDATAVGNAFEIALRQFPAALLLDHRVERLEDGRRRTVLLLSTTEGAVRAEVSDSAAANSAPRVDYLRADAVIASRPPEVSHAAFSHLLSSVGLVAGPQYVFSPVVSASIPGPPALDAVPTALARAARDAGLSATPDPIAFTSVTNFNDYAPDAAWWLKRIEAPIAWDTSTGLGTIVGVIDSGLNHAHPDIAANVWTNPAEVPGNGLDDDANGLVDDIRGWDFAGNDADPSDVEGHGSHVSGIIAAVGGNGTGIVGVAPRAKVLTLRTGDRTLTTAAVIQALDYLTMLRTRGQPIVAVNNSYTSNTYSSLQEDSIARARDAGIVFVASAGNDRRDIDSVPAYPAAYALTNVIAVAASNLGDGIADYSNFGVDRVPVAAPGSAVLSLDTGSSYTIRDGTSMAAPVVAGAAALLAAAEPGLTATQIKARILGAARPVPPIAQLVGSGGVLSLQRLLRPGATRPSIAWEDVTTRFIATDAAPADLSFSVSASRGVGDVVEGPLTAEFAVVDGPVGTTWTVGANNTATARFNTNGLYRIAARATWNGETVEVLREVLVGPASPIAAPAAWWTMGGTGPTVPDASGSGRNAELVDGAARDVGPMDLDAIRFNGARSAASFDAPAPAEVTLAGWIHMDAAGNSIFPRLLHFPAYYLFAGRDIAGGPDGNVGTVKFLSHWSTTDGVWHSPPLLLGNGRWYHLAATYRSANGRFVPPALYLDGLAVEVGAQTAPAGSIALTQGTGYLGNNPDRNRSLDGRIADTRIYARALRPVEVSALAAEPAVAELRKWAPAVVQTDGTTASTVGLLLPDGRASDSELAITWGPATGPGSVLVTPQPGGRAQLSFGVAGTYRVQVTLRRGAVRAERAFDIALPGSAAAPLAPTIVRNPANRAAAAGEAVEFIVEAGGTAPLSYQWLKDGVDMPGQVGMALRLFNITTANEGLYSVRVTNAVGTVTSEAARLTVSEPPRFTTQPQSVTAGRGSTVVLTAVVAGSPPLTLQWQKDGVALDGENGSSLTIADATGTDAGAYRVLASNDVAAVYSDTATVEILEPPTIVRQSASEIVQAGRTHTLSIEVAGATPFTFQWFKNGSLLSGQSSNQLRFIVIQITDSGTYTFKASNSVGTVTSEPIVLTVVAPPAITVHPQSQAGPPGSRIVLSVTATGSEPLTYQWFRNTLPIPGATSSSYTIESLAESDVGTYIVHVTNPLQTINSSAAFVNITPRPTILNHPIGTTITAGTTVTLNVLADGGGGGLAYRWSRNGTVLPNAVGPSLLLPVADAEDIGIYQAEVINSAGSTFSLPAVVALAATARTAGTVTTLPEWQDIRHPNGNTYDQFLLTGTNGSITADPGQIARLSFLDPDGGITQAEISGPGTLTVLLAAASGPAAAELYNQPSITYMRGRPTILVGGAAAETYIGVYSVGPANNPAVTLPGAVYEGWADVEAIGLQGATGPFGGFRLGNVRLGAGTGAVGLVARGLAPSTPSYLHDLFSSGTARPHLLLGGGATVGLTGGNLFQANGRPVVIAGIASIQPLPGASSAGTLVDARPIAARLEEGGVDVTASVAKAP